MDTVMNRDHPSEGDSPFPILVDRGILAESGDGFELHDRFSNRVAENVAFVEESDDAAVRSEVEACVEPSSHVREYITAPYRDPTVIAEYLSLCEMDDLTAAERALVFTVLDDLKNSPVESDGAPDAFLPVRGDRLPFLVQFYTRAIVYVWMEDCTPCELLREDFDTIFPSPPDDIQLMAVYGPTNSNLLFDLYQVDGAPITLFFFEGDVDVRLRKAPPQSVIATEVANLRDLT